MARTHLFTLLQARNADDPARADEHLAFADKLQVAVSDIRAVDILTEPLTDDVAACSHAVLVGGAGEFSVLDDLPQIHAFIDYLAALAEARHPLFASCFGFQALALGLGGAVIHDEDHAEVGTYDMRLTEQGAKDPLFQALPAMFLAQLGHKDRVSVLPSSCTNLAFSERAPYQALCIPGSPVYATQFHPELSWSENRARFERYFVEYGRVFGAEAAQRQLDGHRPSPEANTLLRSFVEQFVPAALGAE